MPIVLICLMLVYAGLAVFVWHHQKKNARHYPLKTELAILAPALLVHGLVLILPVLHDHVLVMGFGYSVSLIVSLVEQKKEYQLDLAFIEGGLKGICELYESEKLVGRGNATASKLSS